MKIETNVTFNIADGFESYVELTQISSGIDVKESRTLLWGPYIDMPSGSWKVIFNGMFEAGENESTCDVSAETGLVVIGTSAIRSGIGKIAEIDFSIPVMSTNVEFRVSPAVGSCIRIDSIILQRQANCNSKRIWDMGANPVIPVKCPDVPVTCPQWVNRCRNLVENLWTRLKKRRVVAPRYEKNAAYIDTTSLETIPNIGQSFAIYQREGFNLLLDDESMVDREIIYNGSWEQEQLRYIKELASDYRRYTEKKIFLDIGSYFGLYSIHMSRINVFDQIIAFEADELNYRHLQANLLLNDPTFLIKTYNFAVSDKDGEAYFFPSWDHPNKNRGGVGLIPKNFDLVNRVRVSTRALDNILSLSGNIIFAKIDVEGAEFSVLRGMRRILSDNRCVLQIEALVFNPDDVEKHAQTDAILVELGYRRIHSIGPDNYYSNFR